MAQQDSAILVMICLAVMYSALSVLGVLRTWKMYSKINITKFARFFYLCVCFESIFRSLTLISIASDATSINSRVLFLLASVPDSLFVLLYLILMVITMIVYYYSHISSILTVSFLKKTAVKRSNFVKAAVILLGTVALLIFIFYVMYLSKVQNAIEVTQENAIINIILPGLGIPYILYLDFAFSGIPTRSPFWKNNLHKICIISLFWTFSRIAKGILDLLDASSIINLVNSASDPDNYSVTLVKSVLCLAVLIVGELICMFLVLDYDFFGIFLMKEEEDSLGSKTARARASFVDENPYVSEADVEITEELNTEKLSPLGKLYLAEFGGKQVLYRIMGFSRLSPYVVEEISKEIDSYKGLTVTGIVPILGIIFQPTTVGMIYPYFKSGSLHKLLHESNATLPLAQKLEIILRIAENLEDAHSLNRFHGHLTSYNILMDEENEPIISDLGFHKMKKYAGVMYNYSYKSRWSAPEILKDHKLVPKVSGASDSYSFGMICWEIFSGKEPFFGYSEKQLVESVAIKGLRPVIPDDVPEDIAKLINSCWSEEPQNRPDFSLIVSDLNSRTADGI